MRQHSALIIDEKSEEGRVELGERFKKRDALFQSDILGDWYRQIRELYEDAQEAMFPGAKVEGQRFANWRRRRTCETLVGQTIQAAEPLANGDIMLTFSDGRILVFKADTEDVHINTLGAGEEETAREYAASMVSPKGYYTDEPAEQELLPENIAKQELGSAVKDLVLGGGGH